MNRCSIIRIGLTATLAGFIAAHAKAANLTVNFAASIKTPTCNLYISADSAGNNPGASADIKFDAVPLDKIISNDGSASKGFSLKLDSNCIGDLSKLTTVLKANQTLLNNKAIGNALTDGARNVGVEITRQNAAGTPFTINSSTEADGIVWTSDEIASGLVQLSATLVTAPSPTPGPFMGTALFETTYE